MVLAFAWRRFPLGMTRDEGFEAGGPAASGNGAGER